MHRCPCCVFVTQVLGHRIAKPDLSIDFGIPCMPRSIELCVQAQFGLVIAE